MDTEDAKRTVRIADAVDALRREKASEPEGEKTEYETGYFFGWYDALDTVIENALT